MGTDGKHDSDAISFKLDGATELNQFGGEMAYQGLETLPVIGEAAIRDALTWTPLIDSIENAMIAFSAGEVAQPVRQMVPVPGHDAIIAAMPAVGEAMAVKIVTLYHANAGTDIPTHQAVILIFDKANGSPLAVLDGRLITEMRTAAGSAAAARKLAAKDSRIVTIMGNGVQARAHAQALAEVRSCDELRLWARNEQNGRLRAEEIGAVFHANAEDAVRDADIIACTTSSAEPILEGAWLKPGAFVTSVGWNTSEGRELDDAAMANIVLVESAEAARDQAGDIRGSNCEIFAEIGDVFAGSTIVPEGETIIYDSIGIAIM
ncbi:MAG: ornithine cyclodeaminase family protein [Rhodospirillaceae bacterium]|nr:ornithine cyclodeaminase family protein [Rhodospirillaceae bacterium]MBT3495251.1 ornithine cyclodeaminase family protein [Rhodospirillaceae bacterium]MBT3779375.1 ornithine cyclodeaminase family protein [Rhodospirillaceae bacterium]MBT3975655.1 ornithine cyclodeaminase family protein [Rhodospirillaceae bacterium]MBT4169715.1 ornithine cyclodeaminase family protein [Rhodospirillaceae bacterium]